MSNDKEEGECSSDYSERQRCGKSFRSSSYSSDLELEETDHLCLDMVTYLSGGWGKKRKRGSFGTSPCDSSTLSMGYENKIVVQIGDSFNNETELFVEKKLQEPSKVDKKFKFGATEREKGIHHALDKELVVRDGGYSFKKKIKPDVKNEHEESCDFDKKLKLGVMKGEKGIDHHQKYSGKKCGLELDDFRGHMSFHKKNKRMEQEEDDHEEPKVKKNCKETHQCNQCEKSFPTGQALGGHKKVHWNGRTIKRFDLNQLPPEAKFFGAG